MKYGVAVAGSHGKTTTTSLVATVLHARRPRSDRGHRRQAAVASGSNARLGGGDYLVAEADESDGSFMKLSPTVAVVTNIDPEHLDHYGTLDALKQHVRRLHQQGAVLRARRALRRSRARAVDPAAGREAPRHLRLHAAGAASAPSTSPSTGCARRSPRSRAARTLGRVELAMPGRHNVLNSLAVLAVADFLGVDFDVYQRALAGFSGVGRRFTVRGEARGVMVVDDYGHHPGRDPRHARRRAHRLQGSPHRRRVPAAPLHAHARSARRLRARVQRGRPRRRLRHLRRRRGADRRRVERAARRRDARVGPPAAHYVPRRADVAATLAPAAARRRHRHHARRRRRVDGRRGDLEGACVTGGG